MLVVEAGANEQMLVRLIPQAPVVLVAVVPEQKGPGQPEQQEVQILGEVAVVVAVVIQQTAEQAAQAS